jgi:AraC-like DNA-binding protein
MSILFESRLSESPLVERVWRSRCEQPGPFISMALNRVQLVVWSEAGKTCFTVRGPETVATTAYCPPHEEFVGIVLKCGVWLPQFPPSTLRDDAVTLPEAGKTTFWLAGSAWQFPTYENADAFAARLAQAGLLAYEPVVEAALQGRLDDLSLRSAQRRFLRATGLTHSAVRQIERARYATILLRKGASIFDAMAQADYFDQPHLTRSLRRFIGQTPAQIVGRGSDRAREQLSFLYKTSPVR